METWAHHKHCQVIFVKLPELFSTSMSFTNMFMGAFPLLILLVICLILFCCLNLLGHGVSFCKAGMSGILYSGLAGLVLVAILLPQPLYQKPRLIITTLPIVPTLMDWMFPRTVAQKEHTLRS